MSLGDLDELILSCRNEDGRKYIAEAVRCYKAGAYRACIVSTWIAAVYDLLSKVRELSLSGDAEAQRIVADLNRWQPLIAHNDLGAIKNSLELEREIVGIANDKFGFFDGMEVVELERLHDDRNRCAHPTYQASEQPYAPSAELARAHLVHAVQYVLARAPVQGKAATTQVIRLVESSYFPADVEQAKIQLRSGGLDRARDSFVRAVIDHLVFGYFESEAGLKGRQQVTVAIRALAEMYPDVCEPRVRRALNTLGRRVPDKLLGYFFGFLKGYRRTWEFLEQDNQNRVKEVLRQSSDEIAQYAIPIAVEYKELEETCAERLKRLPLKELSFVAQMSKHNLIIEAGVNMYCSSKTWDQANANYKAIEPAIDELTPAQMRRILTARVNELADLPGAHSFSAFCRHIYKSERLPRTEIIETLNANEADWVARELVRESEGGLPW
jgi:hypothetical protein